MRKFSNFVIYCALTVVLMVLSWTIIANLLVSRPMWGFDFPYFDVDNKYVSIWILLTVIIYFVVIIVIFSILKKKNINNLNKKLCIAGGIFALITIVLIPVAPYADQAAVIGIANNILNGNFIDFQKYEYYLNT